MSCGKCKIKQQLEKLISTHHESNSSEPIEKKMRISHLIERDPKHIKQTVDKIGHNHKNL